MMDKRRVVFASSFHVLFLCLVASVALGASVERVAAAGEAGTAVEEKKKAEEIVNYYDLFFKNVTCVSEFLFLTEKVDLTKCEEKIFAAVSPTEDETTNPFTKNLTATRRFLEDTLRPTGAGTLIKNISAMNNKGEKDRSAFLKIAKNITVKPEAVKKVIDKVNERLIEVKQFSESANAVSSNSKCKSNFNFINRLLENASTVLGKIEKMAEEAETWQAKVFAELDGLLLTEEKTEEETNNPQKTNVVKETEAHQPVRQTETTHQPAEREQKDDEPQQKSDEPMQRQLNVTGEEKIKNEIKFTDSSATEAFQSLTCFFLFALVTFPQGMA